MSFNDVLNDLLDPKPIRWPKKGDLPLRKAQNSDAAGPLARHPRTRTVLMMDGFMRAGAVLADEALKEKLLRHDLVYPMLFCYRHATEMGLKWLITAYGPQLGVMPGDLNDTHDLWKLWENYLLLYQACGVGDGDEDLKAVGQIVKQFHEWDKSGMTFRYATKTNGAAVMFQYPDIDIANLKEVMSGVANFFNGADGWLSSIANV